MRQVPAAGACGKAASVKRPPVIIGARGSMLSVAQTNAVIRALRRAHPGRRFELRTITTLGDRAAKWSRSDTGIFVKEIEDELCAGRIDIAVHSVKDLPSRLPPGLALAAVTKRRDPRDVLITRSGGGLFSLRKGSCIGTSSLRRRAQILHLRPDMRIMELRGNLDTRIRKLRSGSYDAIVVAAAGLCRLCVRNTGARPLAVEIMLPQAGQGALGIEVRADDRFARQLVRPLDDPGSHACIDAERSFLRKTDAGCRMPVAAFAQISQARMALEGMVISLDGTRMIRLSASSSVRDAEALGKRLARQVLQYGGAQILKEIRDGG
ncbi:MAG TPA: hydroxymethylbilane synthase [Candidatus Omnitrophota bacterium]|nr:hydroxymethylbilane synthase [Candidatus Omnitrophota bacterium]HQO37958.1 hydroxymethylbilane synthase [Candidatus Omnitrophota bacterium]